MAKICQFLSRPFPATQDNKNLQKDMKPAKKTVSAVNRSYIITIVKRNDKQLTQLMFPRQLKFLITPNGTVVNAWCMIVKQFVHDSCDWIKRETCGNYLYMHWHNGRVYNRHDTESNFSAIKCNCWLPNSHGGLAYQTSDNCLPWDFELRVNL